MRDPYYCKILEGLDGELPRQRFEDCAVVLLQKAYPRLVPIRGGADAGMDGAMADGLGEAYPFVATTAKNVIGNLTKNLESYLEGGGSRRDVVLATSKSLTPLRRRNLIERAKDFDFTLIQVHDQRDIANRLYRDSRLAKELLGITGEPSALTAHPISGGIVREDLELVGRDDDLRWLRETSGDRLVVGQPGAGKTRLLLELVREDKTLFLTSQDEGAIAAAIRDLEPKIIVADDAHLEPDLLRHLRQLRTVIHADFDVVALSWPGFEADLVEALGGIPRENVRRLDLLTRAEILTVLRSLGVRLPEDDRFLHHLVDLSSNKPGLAVTLGSLWLRGQGVEVLTGQAIKQGLIPALKRVLEHDPTRLLASFALGGDAGMPMSAVAEFLGVSFEDVHRRSALAAHGGILSDLGDSVLKVELAPLRSALLHEVFFTSPPLPYQDLLNHAPNPSSAAEALATAALHGAPVPDPDLRELVTKHGTTDAWRAYAACGREQTEWVVSSYQGTFPKVADIALEVAPRASILRLLQEAQDEASEGPMEVLRKWVRALPDDSGTGPLSRRRLLIDGAKSHLGEGGDAKTASLAMMIALHPELEGKGSSIDNYRAIDRDASISHADVDEMLRLWKEARSIIVQSLDLPLWGEIRNLLHGWNHPNARGGGASGDVVEQMRRFSRRVLADLAPIAKAKPGLALDLRREAARIGLDLDLRTDPALEILFPERPNLDRFEKETLAQQEAASDLGKRWADDSTPVLVDRLRALQAEALFWGLPWPSLVPDLYLGLFAKTTEPEKRLHAFVEAGLDPQLVHIFLREVIATDRPGWRELVQRCLRHEDFRGLAAGLLLNAAEPRDFLDLALEQLEPHQVLSACQGGKVPTPTLRRLLSHPDRKIAIAALVGEWLASPRRKVRAVVRRAWQELLLDLRSSQLYQERDSVNRYWVEKILETDPTLAFDWLRSRLLGPGDGRERYSSPFSIFTAALRGLEDTQKEYLLREVGQEDMSRRLAKGLVGESVVRFELLLDREDLQEFHLVPLAGRVPDASWIPMAELALQKGFSARQLAERAFRFEGAMGGFGEDHWRRWADAFQDMESSTDGALARLAAHGRRLAEVEIEEARSKKREFEMTGRF